MKPTLVILNLIAAALVFPAMWLVHSAQVASAQSMYTELDRAQVIDRARLEGMYPEESKNDRYLIAERYVGRRKNAWMLGYPCIFGFIANAILIGFFMKGKGQQNKTPKHISKGRGRPSENAQR